MPDPLRDSTQAYLSDAGATPLLTRGQETMLAKRLARNKRIALRLTSRIPCIARDVLEMGDVLRSNPLAARTLLALPPKAQTDAQLRTRARAVVHDLDVIRAAQADAGTHDAALGAIPVRHHRRARRARWAALRARVRLSHAVGAVPYAESVKLRLVGRATASLDAVEELRKGVDELERRQRTQGAASVPTASGLDEARALLLARVAALGLTLRQATHIRARLRAATDGIAEAKHALVAANLRLVIANARRYHHHSLGFLDLVQEGNLGLLRAVDKFDHRLGYKFSTYATWWIRQGMTRALAEKGRIIRLPVHVADTLRTVLAAADDLAKTLGREPTAAEIAQRIDLPPARVRTILRAGLGPLSLEAPNGSDDSHTLGHTIEDHGAVSPSESAMHADLRRRIAAVLHTLPPRDAKILRMRFGLEDGRERTLEQIGRAFGLTRERIRQIEYRALAQLRQSPQGRRLADD